MGDYDRLVGAMMAFVEQARDRGTPAMEAVNKMKSLLQRHLRQNNYNYLRTVFFPEFSKGARYPNRFPVSSNTFTMKESFVLPASATGVFGCVIKPNALTSNSAFLYLFNNADSTNWGKGLPFSASGQYIGLEEVAGFSRELDNNATKSPRLYFEKSRLIGCSVLVNPVTPVNGLYIGGVSYETPINEISSQNSEEQIGILTRNTSYFLQESYSHALEMQVLASAKDAAFYADVANNTRAKFPNEWQWKDITDAIRDRIIIHGAGGAVTGATFQGILQGLIGQQVTIKAPVETTNFLQRLFWGRQFRSEESVMREIENSVKREPPTRFELLVRLLRIAKMNKIGFGTEPDYRDTIGDAAVARVRGEDAGNQAANTAQFTNMANTALATLQSVVNDYAKRWTFSHAENLARIAKDITASFKTLVDAESFPGNVLNYNTVKDICQYYHESKGMDGIRMVYIPNKEPTWTGDYDGDTMYIGAQGFAPGAKLQISIVRHFEGIGNPGVREIFPGKKELPDLQSIDMVNNIFTLYPNLIHIPAARVEEYYRAMKSQFKWFDMVIYERGGVMEIERPLSIPNRNAMKIREADEIPSIAN
jgi:hypothetical protein